MDPLAPYRTQSRWTDPGRWTPLLAAIPPDPQAILAAVPGLLFHPLNAPLRGVALPETAFADQGVRGVGAMLDRLLARDDGPLARPRPVERRFVCVCSGFARVATAVFRAHGVPARCRVGFAGYFNPGWWEDHWVCEFWTGDAWRLLDAQLDPESVRTLGIAFDPTDVPRDRFLDASTAWLRTRAGALDPSRVGLSPFGLAGAWFVLGDVLLDVAALNKEELLPWEKWSVGLECGPGRDPAPDAAARLDDVARTLAGAPDAATAARVYDEQPWLRVTPTVLSMLGGVPTELRLDATP